MCVLRADGWSAAAAADGGGGGSRRLQRLGATSLTVPLSVHTPELRSCPGIEMWAEGQR